MAETISTGLRLLRLLAASWHRPLLSLKDIQTILSEDDDDPPVTPETALNYLSSLEELGVSIERQSTRLWRINATPALPMLALNNDLQATYRKIRLSGQSQHLGLLDKLMGIQPEAGSFQVLPDGWENACLKRQVCDIHTCQRWIQVVPLEVSPQANQTVLAWDMALELPLRLAVHNIKACHPQPHYRPDLLSPTVIVQFEITGMLASRFEPALGDTVLHRQPGCIRVAHRCQDATALCRRLLRYQLDCQVIAPQSLKKLLVAELDWLQHGLCRCEDI